MCVEIEAKLKVDSLQQISATLTGLGAKFVESHLQRDCHFDNAKMTLQKSDRCLRLRIQTAGQSKRFFLTYKGPKEKSRFKKRQEIEIEIPDGDSMLKLFSALGFDCVFVIEKKRHLWRLANCEIALDELPLLGNFVEIEGPDEDKIANVQSSLGLFDLPHIKKGYAALIRDKLHELGKEQKEDVLQY